MGARLEAETEATEGERALSEVEVDASRVSTAGDGMAVDCADLDSEARGIAACDDPLGAGLDKRGDWELDAAGRATVSDEGNTRSAEL